MWHLCWSSVIRLNYESLFFCSFEAFVDVHSLEWILHDSEFLWSINSVMLLSHVVKLLLLFIHQCKYYMSWFMALYKSLLRQWILLQWWMNSTGLCSIINEQTEKSFSSAAITVHKIQGIYFSFCCHWMNWWVPSSVLCISLDCAQFTGPLVLLLPVFTWRGTWSLFGLTYKIPPLGSIFIYIDADVKKWAQVTSVKSAVVAVVIVHRSSEWNSNFSDLLWATQFTFHHEFLLATRRKKQRHFCFAGEIGSHRDRADSDDGQHHVWSSLTADVQSWPNCHISHIATVLLIPVHFLWNARNIRNCDQRVIWLLHHWVTIFLFISGNL